MSHGAAELLALSLVIPVFNEEESLPALFEALDAAWPTLPKPAEAVLVDDGSRDRSFALLREASATRPWLKVVCSKELGQTAAIAAGIDHSRGESSSPSTPTCRTTPATSRACSAPRRRLRRRPRARRDRKDKAVTRRAPSMVANWLIGRVSGVRIHDYGCTLKAYRRWCWSPTGSTARCTASSRSTRAHSWRASPEEMEVTHHPAARA
ncbi:MAG: glycosyltransferase [Polyangiales bacterium]